LSAVCVIFIMQQSSWHCHCITTIDYIYRKNNY